MSTHHIWFMHALARWAQDTTIVTSHMFTCNNCYLLDLADVIWHWSMCVGHKWYRQDNAHTPCIRIAGLGLCWCHSKMSYATCTHDTFDICIQWPVTPRWCTHTMVDVCMPWHWQASFSLYAHVKPNAWRPWPMSSTIADARKPLLMSLDRRAHTMFDVRIPLTMLPDICRWRYPYGTIFSRPGFWNPNCNRLSWPLRGYEQASFNVHHIHTIYFRRKF